MRAFWKRLRRIRTKNSEKGQASIMMGIMMLTFVFFFAFVVNVGMLVNAKINLQNAADLAAYAGAAVQARQLTHISYLNYEMRRHYKKFIFRYYVLGNMAQKNFPRNGAGGAGNKTPRVWSPDGRPELGAEHDYKSPVVCMIFKSNDNPCQITRLMEIIKPAQTSFDTINDTLIAAMEKMEQIRQNNCMFDGEANTMVLTYWLWNTDPWLEQTLAASRIETQQLGAVIKGLAHGIGLIPREILLKRRIDTLAEFVNQTPLTGVDFDKVTSLTSGEEPAATERTIQAFLSAYYTLGNHTFAEGVQLDELMPENQLRLVPIEVRFAAHAIGFDPPGSGGGDCVKKVTVDGVTNPLPVGVYKDPTILTYYALRLKAKARLMFSPFGDLNLSAYSAAQPFGSRIGPPLKESDFVRPGNLSIAQTSESQGANSNLSPMIPNLPLRDEDDSAAAGFGWDTEEAMGSMYQAFKRADANGAMGEQIDEEALQRAYHVAMAPNHYEAKKYNIPFDGDDPFVRNFDSARMMAFYAPIFPHSKMASMDSELENLLKKYVPTGTTNQQRSLNLLKAQFSKYLGQLRQGQGESYDLKATPSNQEGFRIARIADPVNTRPGGGGEVGPIGGFGGFVMTNPKDFRTSWADVWNGDFEEKGRIGYSVKFVSFKYLNSGVQTAPGQTSKNRFNPDASFEQDIEFIKH